MQRYEYKSRQKASIFDIKVFPTLYHSLGSLYSSNTNTTLRRLPIFQILVVQECHVNGVQTKMKSIPKLNIIKGMFNSHWLHSAKLKHQSVKSLRTPVRIRSVQEQQRKVADPDLSVYFNLVFGVTVPMEIANIISLGI